MREIEVESEVAGTVWKIETAEGQTVMEEDSLMILESMKMEIPVFAPEDAIILKIHVTEGQAVREGQVLATLKAT